MRAEPASPALSLEDAVEIHRRHRLGEAQHVIAAGFGVDRGRISEVVGGKRFPEAKAIAMTGRSA